MGAKRLTPEQRRRTHTIAIAIMGASFWLVCAAMLSYRGYAFKEYWGGLTVWALLSGLSAYRFLHIAGWCGPITNTVYLMPPLLMDGSRALNGKSWGEITLISAKVSGAMLAVWIVLAVVIRLLLAKFCAKKNASTSAMFDSDVDRVLAVEGAI
jgi:hypothetical protein